MPSTHLFRLSRSALSQPAVSLSKPSKGSALLATRYSLPATTSAFTLVEVMMAVIILGAGFLGMIEAITLGSGMMDNARRQTLATQIVNHEIEKLRLASWSTISGLSTTSTSITIDSRFTAAVAASGATFTLTRTTADIVPGSLREATFTITWVVNTSRHDSLGNLLSFSYSRTLTGYYGKYGLNLSNQRS